MLLQKSFQLSMPITQPTKKKNPSRLIKMQSSTFIKDTFEKLESMMKRISNTAPIASCNPSISISSKRRLL